MGVSVLGSVFKSNRVVGVVGNSNSGKSSLVLSELIKLRENYDVPVYVFGVESSLKPFLNSKGVKFLYNVEDILDLRLRDCVIFVDEVADFFSTRARDKQTQKFKRFVNRIVHNNCWFVPGTAETGFWNKFACSLVNVFFVKEIEFASLVNNTWLKRLVCGLPSNSDYRVELPVNSFFVVGSEGLTERFSFDYVKELDAKVDNVNFFRKSDEKSDRKGDVKDEK